MINPTDLTTSEWLTLIAYLSQNITFVKPKRTCAELRASLAPPPDFHRDRWNIHTIQAALAAIGLTRRLI